MKNPEYKKVNRITIGFDKPQFDLLKQLEAYGINISQFARLAIKEKIKKDYKNIKIKQETIKMPF